MRAVRKTVYQLSVEVFCHCKSIQDLASTAWHIYKVLAQLDYALRLDTEVYNTLHEPWDEFMYKKVSEYPSLWEHYQNRPLVQGIWDNYKLDSSQPTGC